VVGAVLGVTDLMNFVVLNDLNIIAPLCGARGNVVDGGTMLQAGRSRVSLSMVSLNIFN
jgi:hypothetical protein